MISQSPLWSPGFEYDVGSEQHCDRNVKELNFIPVDCRVKMAFYVLPEGTQTVAGDLC